MINESYRIVITGYSGFLGKNLMERFNNSEFLLIGRDHKEIEMIKDFNPDFIFHFGAEIYNQEDMIDSNIIFTYKILESIKDIDFKAFIYCGSSSEYGLKSLPMKEIDLLEPRNMYEATKGSCTLICRAYAKMYNKPIGIVRPFSVYGRYEKEHRFIPTLFRKFEERSEITISPGYHDFVHIDDFIDGVLCFCFSATDKIKGEIINLGYGKQYSNYEVYEIFCEVFGYNIVLNKIDSLMRDFDNNNWISDIKKAKDLYNYSPKYDLKMGIKQIYDERNNR